MRRAGGLRRNVSRVATQLTPPDAPLRLAFIAPGNSVHTRRWLEFFVRRGHRVGLVSYGPLTVEIAGAEVLLELPSLGCGRGGLRRAWQLARDTPRVRRALRRFDPDLVHAHFLTGPGWLGLLGGRRPLVLSAWGSDVLVHPSRFVVRVLHRLTIARAAAATCDAEEVRQAVIRLGLAPERVHVILWGVETDSFRPDGPAEREGYGLPLDGYIVLAIRGVRPVQNPDTVLEGFALLAAQRADAVLGLMLGPEAIALPEPLSRRIDELGLAARVVPIPSVAHAELPALFRAADVCVSVPSSDGTSVAVLEAMACARAVVVSDIPANRVWVRDGENGLVVPLRNAEALGAALSRLGSGPLRDALGNRAREAVADSADSTRNLGRAEDLYRATVTGSGTATAAGFTPSSSS